MNNRIVRIGLAAVAVAAVVVIGTVLLAGRGTGAQLFSQLSAGTDASRTPRLRGVTRAHWCSRVTRFATRRTTSTSSAVTARASGG